MIPTTATVRVSQNVPLKEPAARDAPSVWRSVLHACRERYELDLPGVVRVVQRHPDELSRDRRVRAIRHAGELLRSRGADGGEEAFLIVVQQVAIDEPRGLAQIGRRLGPPGFSNSTRKRLNALVRQAFDQEVAPMREMEHELPDRMSVR